MAVSVSKVVKWERGSAELTQTSFSHQFGIWVYFKKVVFDLENSKNVLLHQTQTHKPGLISTTKSETERKNKQRKTIKIRRLHRTPDLFGPDSSSV